MGSEEKTGAKRVTLVDVARDANVSRATASLVLRNSPLVAEDTRKRVLAAMARLGYVYNRAAAALRTRQTHSVGLIVTDITNPFFSQMAVASEETCERADYAVLLSNTAESVERQARLLTTMGEYGVDGLLLCPAEGSSPDLITRLRATGMPFVLVSRYLGQVPADYVGGDNRRGAELAVELLFGLGHRRIAFVGGPERSSARHDRLQGYRQALQGHGLQPDAALSITSPVNHRGGYQAIDRLLALPDPPTAALCYNDVVAFGVMLGLQAAGLAPGPDFSVVGFDDIEEAAMWRPALTTVAIRPADVGVAAACLLLERVSHPKEAPRSVIVPPNLVVRDSCGPVSV